MCICIFGSLFTFCPPVWALGLGCLAHVHMCCLHWAEDVAQIMLWTRVYKPFWLTWVPSTASGRRLPLLPFNRNLVWFNLSFSLSLLSLRFNHLWQHQSLSLSLITQVRPSLATSVATHLNISDSIHDQDPISLARKLSFFFFFPLGFLFKVGSIN